MSSACALCSLKCWTFLRKVFHSGRIPQPNDKGFATKPWRSCEVINHVIQLNGSYANAMGNAVLTNASGKTTKLDKAWVFIREPDGSIRILLHHSSLPYGA